MSLHVKLLTIGKPKKKYISLGLNDFLERLGHYCKIDIVELKEPPKTSKTSDIKILQLEAEKLKLKIKSGDYVISLDRKGEMLNSKGLANFLQDCMNQRRKSIVFIIGGELGLDKNILEKSNKVISFSKLTFTHDMTRLILLEQLYRAFTIIAGEKYHK